MNQQNLNTLLPLLDKLSEQVENALLTPDGISLIEKDLLKETLRRFYDAVDQIPVVKNDPAVVNRTTPEVGIPAGHVSVHSVAESVMDALRSHAAAKQEQPVESVLASETPQSGAVTKEEMDIIETIAEATPVVTAAIVHESPLATAPEVPLAVTPVAAVQQPEPVVAAVQPEPATVSNTPLTPKAPIEEKVVETRTKHLYAAAMYEEQSTVAAKYTAPETLGDKVTRESSTRRLSDQLKASPLADLKSSIGINERFAFINELFSGDQPAYLHSIEQINKMHTYQEAQTFLHEQLLKQYQWKPQSERFLQFDELVKRRFNA